MRVRTIEYNHPGIVEANRRGLMPAADPLNNVGRLCSLPNDKIGRQWRVDQALVPAGESVRPGNTQYIVRHTSNGEYRVIDYSGTPGGMTSLY